MKKIVIMVVVLMTALVGIALSSCNVTRKVTTEAAYYQKGDTTVQIITKTTETYDASKK